MTMNQRDNEMLAEFRRRLPSDVKLRLRAILAYGSRVRGDASDDSDLDVVALVDGKTSECERKLEDIAYEVMWDFDFNPILSLKVFADGQFQDAARQGLSYYRNVLSEGLSV
jgi:predicted nucleotidyltransferase